MTEQILNENWSLHEAGSTDWYPARVPGSVYADLMRAGAMEDPYWKANEEDALKRMEKDYEYRTSFDAAEELDGKDRVLLRFDGLDTIADITMNGVRLGTADNMHCYWEFDVTGLLKQKDNELIVYFHSPTEYIKKAYEAQKTEGSRYAMPGFPHIRKAHCMFGWDWGPRLPDAGIWRKAALFGIDGGRLTGVLIGQDHSGVTGDGKGNVVLSVTPETELCAAKNSENDSYCGASANTASAFATGSSGGLAAQEEIVCRCEIMDPEGTVCARQVIPLGTTGKIEIAGPKLWWPNGFGGQPLYTVRLSLEKDGRVIDTRSERIGLRTMTIDRHKDEWGESFAHQINGISIFAMGADYIPEDNILSRVTKDRTRNLLTRCRDANFNTIRVWGGGYYPDDWFYDICDELGLVVWQDFMFACAVYDLNEAFEENIIRELTQNIRRLRNHASLGLWCGNNEMEMFVKQGEWVSVPKERADYIKMYEYIFPKLVKKYSPDVFYWPASPSSGGSFDDPNGENRGDVHYWSVWHGNVPFSDYRKYYFRYLSEFGFQAFPGKKTIESFTDDPDDYNIFSYVMEKHQRNDAANGKIINYMSQTYLYPTDFEILLYASQLLQADAIRCGVEHFRRNRGRCMGAVYWQLNDIWPVASWASIDYCGRYKALQYYARRFFAPVLLSCEEEGLLTQNADANAIPYEVKKSVRFNVSNETRADRQVRVVFSLRGADSAVKESWKEDLFVPALTAVWLEKVEIRQAGLCEDHVSYELYEIESREEDGLHEAGETEQFVSSGSVIFSVPKRHHFLDPKLTVSAAGDVITVRSEAYARSVEILNEKEDLILTDNYFDMEAGERTVRILSGKPDGLRVRSVYNIR